MGSLSKVICITVFYGIVFAQQFCNLNTIKVHQYRRNQVKKSKIVFSSGQVKRIFTIPLKVWFVVLVFLKYKVAFITFIPYRLLISPCLYPIFSSFFISFWVTFAPCYFSLCNFLDTFHLNFAIYFMKLNANITN